MPRRQGTHRRLRGRGVGTRCARRAARGALSAGLEARVSCGARANLASRAPAQGPRRRRSSCASPPADRRVSRGCSTAPMVAVEEGQADGKKPRRRATQHTSAATPRAAPAQLLRARRRAQPLRCPGREARILPRPPKSARAWRVGRRLAAASSTGASLAERSRRWRRVSVASFCEQLLTAASTRAPCPCRAAHNRLSRRLSRGRTPQRSSKFVSRLRCY